MARPIREFRQDPKALPRFPTSEAVPAIRRRQKPVHYAARRLLSGMLGNKNMATRQVFVDDNSSMSRTCCSFAKGLAARKQTKAFIRAKWNIPAWATGDDKVRVPSASGRDRPARSQAR